MKEHPEGWSAVETSTENDGSIPFPLPQGVIDAEKLRLEEEQHENQHVTPDEEGDMIQDRKAQQNGGYPF